MGVEIRVSWAIEDFQEFLTVLCHVFVSIDVGCGPWIDFRRFASRSALHFTAQKRRNGAEYVAKIEESMGRRNQGRREARRTSGTPSSSISTRASVCFDENLR